MSEIYKNLKPQRVFYYFEEISKIPRGSRNTKAISDYLVSFAKEHKLAYIQDELNNVIITKEATPDRVNDTGVILQGHMDMVCEKTPDSNHDFEKDGLELYVEGDMLMAKDTTLGGDDGIAVAYALAILEDEELSHPKLEVIITVDEEIGMLGAKDIDISSLTGEYVLNLDCEGEGILWVGCAGGMTIDATVPITRNTTSGIKATIKIDGLAGGHSGAEIDKGRLNATVALGRLLFDLNDLVDFEILDIRGGLKDNAIPRNAQAEIVIANFEDKEVINKVVAAHEKMLKNEVVDEDSNLSLSVEFSKVSGVNTIKTSDAGKILFFLNMAPNGIKCMSKDINGLVETSDNLGIFYTEDDKMFAEFSVRSSVATKKADLANKIIFLTEMLGGDCNIEGDYPAWEFRKESKLRPQMIDIYKEMFGAEPGIQAVHAGLECGYFVDKNQKLDIVSFGPDIFDIHTTEERMSISSVERTYNYVLEILRNIK